MRTTTTTPTRPTLWADGETLPWVFTREAIEDAGGDTLMLEPPAVTAD